MSESSEESEEGTIEAFDMDPVKEVIINGAEEEEDIMMETSIDAVVKGWLKWCRSHSQVKCVEADVPPGILPKGYRGVLIDVKVAGNKRAPDDKIYLAHQLLRERVARGNTILELSKIEKGRIASTKYIFLVFALKKFSGGLGDEDEGTYNQSQWESYFTQHITTAKTMIATEKANGEAAHVSCIKLFGKDYFCFGSKNVHLLANSKEDVLQYTDGRYQFARTVARSFYGTYLDNPEISDDKKKSLISFLQTKKYTGVAEIIQPDNQHVVNLSYLTGPELRFICWTKPDLEDNFSGKDSYCAIPPNQCLDEARNFGLQTINYEEVNLDNRDRDLVDVVEEYMEKIRSENGYEGKVLYFLDSNNKTIGLIKKKTAWYILLRALREKVALFSSTKKSYSLSEKKEMVKKRFKAIQTWLGFSNNFADDWMKLASAFVSWMSSYKASSSESVRSNFPVIFDKFIQTSSADKVLYEKILQCSDMKTY